MSGIESLGVLSDLGSVPGVESNLAVRPDLGSVSSMGRQDLGSIPGGTAHMRPGIVRPDLGSLSGQVNLGSIQDLKPLSSREGLMPTTKLIEKSFTGDSGHVPGEFSTEENLTKTTIGDRDADGMSDNGRGNDRQIMGDISDEFPCGDLKTNSVPAEVSSELERALQKLTPEEVERRRRRLGGTLEGSTFR